MNEPTVPDAEIDDDGEADAGDQTLDGYEADLDAVAGALEALDADDLDTAEALVAGLAEVEAGSDADVGDTSPDSA